MTFHVFSGYELSKKVVLVLMIRQLYLYQAPRFDKCQKQYQVKNQNLHQPLQNQKFSLLPVKNS